MKLDPILDRHKIDIRDQFAIEILKIELAATVAEGQDIEPEVMAKWLYDRADAMISERNKRIK